MDEAQRLVATLKRRLKSQSITYRSLASQLGLSEASVKRMFSRGTFTLERLSRIAALTGANVAEIADEAMRTAPRLRALTVEQERELVSAPRLLLVAACILNGWTPAEINETYMLGPAETIRLLVRLDRMGLIALMPGNRVRLNVARDFEWRPRGPIQRFFQEQEKEDFLAGDFSGEGESMAFHFAMVAPSAAGRLRPHLEKLRDAIAELHREGMSTPFPERRGLCVLVAHRNWEPRAFARLRRPPTRPPRQA